MHCKIILRTQRNTFIVLSLLIISLAILLSPYYILREDSAVGWYDEMDLPIPSMLIHLKAGADYSTLVAGGSYLLTNFLPLNQLTSIYELISMLFPPWLSAAFFRLINYVGLIAIVFVYLQQNKSREIRESDSSQALILAGVISFASIYMYGWVLGGYGLMFPAIYLVAYLVVAIQPTLKSIALLLAAIYIAANSYGSGVVFMVTLPIVAACMHLDLRRNPVAQVLGLLVFAIIIFAIIDIKELKALNELINSESARVHGFSYLDDMQKKELSLKEVVIDLLRDSNASFFSNKVSYVFLYLLPTALIVGGRKSITKHCAVLSLILMYYIFFILLLPGKYRADQIFIFCFPMVCLLSSRVIINYGVNSARPVMRLLALLAIFFAGIAVANENYNRNKISVSEITAGNTWSAYSDLAVNYHDKYDASYRAYVETPYRPRPEFLQVGGLRTIDGMRPSFTTYRTAFWFGVLPDNATDNIHTHRQTAFNLQSQQTRARIAALELANVRYLFSKGIVKDEFGRNTSDSFCFKHASLCQTYFQIYDGSIDRFFESRSVGVRELNNPWDYVFVPTSVLKSKYDALTIEYVRKLRDIDRHQILLDKNVSDFLFNRQPITSEIKSDIMFESIDGGLRVKSARGLDRFVINEEHSKRMTASCVDKSNNVYLTRVNLIQTYVVLDHVCSEIIIRY